MVTSVLCKPLPDPKFVHGRGKWLEAPAYGSAFWMNRRGSEIRRYNQSGATCRPRSRGLRADVRIGKRAKRWVVNVSFAVVAPGPEDEGGIEASEEEESLAIDVDDDDDPDSPTYDELCCYRGLVLDVAYRPINVVNWKRALCLDILEKAQVLEYYDQVIYSPNKMFFIPAVLKVSGIVNTPRPKETKLTLNRRNILRRDKFKCQYCDANDNLTIDHVYAASRGGRWTWENLVTACSFCNVKKANKTPEEARMKLKKAPKEPKLLELANTYSGYRPYGSLRVQEKTPPEWINYLPSSLPLFQ